MHNRYGDSRAVTPTTNQPGFWQTIGDQIPGLARGAYSGLLGLPGDVEEIAMAASPYALLSQGKISPQRFSNLATQEYSPGLLTSEEIADPLRKEGLLSKRPLEGEYTELAGMFLSPDMFVGDLAKLGAVGLGASIFTSPAQKAVREVGKEALPSQQWLKQLEGRGVKKDELEWTGLLGFLKGKKGNIQKSEVEDFIEANKIDVQEVVKGGGKPSEEIGELAREQTTDELYALMTNDEIMYRNRNRIEPLLQKYRSHDITEPEMELLNEWYAPWGDNYANEYFVSRTSEIERSGGLYGPDVVKFSESKYQLPGGENYRELVLTLPEKKVPYTKEDIVPLTESQLRIHNLARGGIRRSGEADADKFYWFNTPDGLKKTTKKKYKATDFLVDDPDAKFIDTQIKSPEEALEQVIKEMNEVKKSRPMYTGGHYDEPNVLSHIRFNERVDLDGNRTLFIEEIQSDWAQKGRKVGFSGELAAEIRDKLQKEFSQKQSQFEDAAKKYFEGRSEPGREQNDLMHQINILSPTGLAKVLGVPNDEAAIIHSLPMEMGALDNRLAGTGESGIGIPRAPFLEDTNQWAGLSMKRMVKWASDNGFDSIGWTTGKQQAKRYDLSKQISEIHYSGSDLSALDHNGMEVIIKTGVHPDDLADYIGKEASEKLMKQSKTEVYKSRKVRSLKGQDLEVGGEGMAGFYDKILVDQAKKIGKKYGAKVELQPLPVELPPKPKVEDVGRLRYEVRGGDGEALDAFETREAAQHNLDYTYDRRYEDAEVFDLYDEALGDYPERVLQQKRGDKVWTMKLPDKLKEAAKEGLPYYALVPPGLLAVGAQRERQSLLE